MAFVINGENYDLRNKTISINLYDQDGWKSINMNFHLPDQPTEDQAAIEKAARALAKQILGAAAAAL